MFINKMPFSVHYVKHKNTQLFSNFKADERFNVQETQNYIPIYDRFFSLNNTNRNSISLNHRWHISGVAAEERGGLVCNISHVSGDTDLATRQPIFVKYAPLLDPFKYVVGKYSDIDNDNKLFNLPHVQEPDAGKHQAYIHPKIADVNNSSYTDGFFYYLCSQMLHTHSFIHGVDYYGSFVGIKHQFKLNVIDDIEYLSCSDFFTKNKNVLFTIEDFSHIVDAVCDKPKKPINISNGNVSLGGSVKSIDESMFENIFSKLENDTHVECQPNNETTRLENMCIENVPVGAEFDIINKSNSLNSLNSSSTCSSRTSHTNSNDTIDDSESESSEQYETDNSDDDYSTISGSDDEESLTMTIPRFPVQVICLEKCTDTLDKLIINDKLSPNEWISAFMQIIMMLVTYQKVFQFTHNDLHTNNVMYISTAKKYLYYCFDKKFYKVPTHGRIYKLIDFGRSIYKFDGKIFCSDSFASGGDAATQYNTEPYFNDKKSRVEPNFSFDLCRFGCSLFDHVIDDFDMLKNLDAVDPHIKIIVDWCTDDNNLNILYKNNGAERYPDFKLYKMIARGVHRHVPQNQLSRPSFSKFIVKQKNIPSNEHIMNIDALPNYATKL